MNERKNTQAENLPPQRLSPVEVVVLDGHQSWDTTVVEIPEEIAETQSQDAFIKWVYSDGGENFMKTLSGDVAAVYVMSWRNDLIAAGHPSIVNEPDALYGRGDSLRWRRFERSDDETVVAYAVFQVWEQGERDIVIGSENVTIYTQSEAEGHLETLEARAGKFDYGSEIDSLRKALGNG